jgi:prepilin-type N-terminal cleavage/methylation domain-containing protein
VSRVVRHLVRDERGFTLTEMMAVIAILGILLAGFMTFITTTITTSTQEQQMTALQTEARAAVEQFASELRTAYAGVDGTWPIEAIGATSIRFTTPQRITPFRLQRIEWQVAAGDLQRRFVSTSDTDGAPWVWPTAITNATWATRARSIRNAVVFEGLDETGAATTTAANVRTVRITLDVSTVGQSSRTFRFQTSVTPRVSPP